MLFDSCTDEVLLQNLRKNGEKKWKYYFFTVFSQVLQFSIGTTIKKHERIPNTNSRTNHSIPLSRLTYITCPKLQKAHSFSFQFTAENQKTKEKSIYRVKRSFKENLKTSRKVFYGLTEKFMVLFEECGIQCPLTKVFFFLSIHWSITHFHNQKANKNVSQLGELARWRCRSRRTRIPPYFYSSSDTNQRVSQIAIWIDGNLRRLGFIHEDRRRSL